MEPYRGISALASPLWLHIEVGRRADWTIGGDEQGERPDGVVGVAFGATSASLGAPNRPMGAMVLPVLSEPGEILICLHRVTLARRYVTTQPPLAEEKMMRGSQKTVLAAIGAAVLGVSLAAGAAATHTSAHVRLAGSAYVAAPGDPVPVDPGPNVPKVSANTASQDAIASALKVAGVPSPNRWAAEVVEYRPYAISDLGLAKLRENLAKYNPAQKTVDQIVSVLQP
jgi:hypothetical protein